MATHHPLLHRLFPYFKWTVFGLLALNMVMFFLHETLVEGFDSLAWFLLLMLFEWESSQLDKPYSSRWERWSIHGGRMLAYVVIVTAAVGYSLADYRAEHGPVDMFNAWTWLAIVALLEYDVYAPGQYGRWEWYLRNTAKFVLYAALFVYAVLWGLAGGWLDAYDAMLWILCFFAIEINVLEYEEQIPYAGESVGDPLA